MALPTAVTPAGWPAEVRPPGTPGWETSAIAYLFDCCPANFRGYPVLRNHPIVLAQFARQFVTGQCSTTAAGLAEVRTSLRGCAPPEVVEAATQAWHREGALLLRTRRGVGLIEDALRGTRFVATL